MNGECFYADGLRFSCAACSVCCRYEAGYVFLSEEDAASLAAAAGVSRQAFIGIYGRWVRWPDEQGGHAERLSLRERETPCGGTVSHDCIFWREKCTVYEARPLQCRSYPFWSDILTSKETWQANAQSCPGVNHGRLYHREEIDRILAQTRAQKILIRRKEPS
jgi:Fe-S-cluster containining protein